MNISEMDLTKRSVAFLMTVLFAISSVCVSPIRAYAGGGAGELKLCRGKPSCSYS